MNPLSCKNVDIYEKKKPNKRKKQRILCVCFLASHKRISFKSSFFTCLKDNLTHNTNHPLKPPFCTLTYVYWAVRECTSLHDCLTSFGEFFRVHFGSLKKLYFFLVCRASCESQPPQSQRVIRYDIFMGFLTVILYAHSAISDINEVHNEKDSEWLFFEKIFFVIDTNRR